ncbi:DUF881 domain-containing protein [Actinomyces sp. B33]|uniref:DUF881 domain-containing protein n=1 Tax=Actinomyces sp. B33 TaxID=2942131 RepID=UPI0023425DF6|nr:DUF881 domain-containing protein [Actinomyces sp. B33]MDC4233302.1 DUF881 domain-containing protein [Actinomyces sp. B33]
MTGPEDPLHGRGGGEGDAPPASDPAASMSLLTRLLANPLDTGYTSYEGPEAADGREPTRLLVLLLAALLGFTSIVAVRSLRVADRADVVGELLDHAQSQQALISSLDGDVQSLSTRIRGYDAASAASVSDDPALAVATSTAEVAGPGLVVTLSDGSDAAVLARGLSGAVRDQDLNVVVNALWSAGAEAIAVNGVRIGPGTFIRTAGSVMLIDIEPIRSPYEVQAIGDANALSVALVRGATGDYLSSAQSLTGMTMTTAGSRELVLGARDPRATRYAVPADAPSGG